MSAGFQDRRNTFVFNLLQSFLLLLLLHTQLQKNYGGGCGGGGVNSA